MSSTGTAIEWADVAHSVVRGCSRASAGCDNCYSARMDGTRLQHRAFVDTGGERHTMGELVKIFPGAPKIGRRGQRLRGHGPNRYAYNGKVYLDPAALQAALDLPRTHKGKRGYSVFWNHRSDTFHESLPEWAIDAQVAVWLIRQDLRMLVLTKRAMRAHDHLTVLMGLGDHARFLRLCDALDRAGLGPAMTGDYSHDLLTACKSQMTPWILGVSAENQETADERIPELLATPAAMRFVSYEPALGPLDMTRDGRIEWLSPFKDTDPFLRPSPRINWLIVGAESGPNARPAELDWVRSVRDQVLAARDGRAVPEPGDPHLFVKQIDVCERCSGDGWARNGYGDPLDGTRIGRTVVRCEPCRGTGLAGKVRKGNPAIDGRRWAEVPR